MTTHRLGALALVGGLALAHCNGSTAGGPTCTPADHRAAATSCAPTPYPVQSDAGTTTCATDADCQTSGSSSHCVAGQCSFDECLVDADCANGGICGCSTDYYGGNAAYHPNVCVPADCHVDSDCGSGGVCAPSFGLCGSFDSFHCAPASAGACSGNDACNFSPEVGHFTCGAAAVCNG